MYSVMRDRWPASWWCGVGEGGEAAVALGQHVGTYYTDAEHEDNVGVPQLGEDARFGEKVTHVAE